MSWKITKDHISQPDEESRVGYREEHARIPVQAAILGYESPVLPQLNAEKTSTLPLIPFRLYDDDGELYYEGILHDDEECLNQSAALRWAEGDAGCTTIKVLRNNEWELEIG
jgi:hypothetical protein